jgi:membrane protein implicated in regulation of membrane protease activity
MGNRVSTGQIILIVLIVLILTGTISFGAILKGFMHIILGIVALSLLAGWLLRRRIRRMAGQNYEQQHRSTKREGEVSVEQKQVREKEVNTMVGEYVEFEEIDEKQA